MSPRSKQLVKLSGLLLVLFAATFALGSVLRVDQLASVRELASTIKNVNGPHFPEGDTLAIAAIIHSRCKTGPEPVKRKCTTEQLLALRVQKGTRFAMGALNVLSMRDKEIEYGGHDYSHMLGITSYKASGDVTSAFKSCTEILQSGCYHGVIQTYFMAQPHVGAAEVSAVCREWTSPDADRWLRFQCVHGMGHGLTMFYDHDLPKALEGCDLLADEWDRKSCYGGAFMENIIFATDPRMAHMVMGDEDGAHAAKTGDKAMAMDMPGMGHGATKYKMVDSTDLTYPCSALGDRYLDDCWGMQPAVMLQLNGGDFANTFKGCDKAPSTYRASCYAGTGTEISGATMRDHRKSINLCSLGQPAYQPACYFGVVKNFIDVTAKSGDGLAFCKVVPNRASQLECYRAVGEEIAVLRNTADTRRPLCDPVVGDEGGKAACLFGGQVITERPAGLPDIAP